MFKRIVLFALTNILVLVTISIVLSLLGVQPYLTAYGIDYKQLMIFCLVWGMGGAFISLAISRWMAKTLMGVKVIAPHSGTQYDFLVEMISNLSRSANLPRVPEVGVYDSADLNAFATGPTKSRSLVAFSTGLIQNMSRQEIEGVAAHEISHIQNGDMVTMTLLQGVVNAIVMFLARVVSFAISQQVKEESRYMVRIIVTIALDIALGILGSVVVAWFSRIREFRADAGSARLAGRESMIAALRALMRNKGIVANTPEHSSISCLKINGDPKGFWALLMSHPPLQERIKRLEAMR